jgi:hypothetical protein
MLMLVVLPQVFDCSPLPMSSNFRSEKVLAMGVPCMLSPFYETAPGMSRGLDKGSQ